MSTRKLTREEMVATFFAMQGIDWRTLAELTYREPKPGEKVDWSAVIEQPSSTLTKEMVRAAKAEMAERLSELPGVVVVSLEKP